MNARLTTLPLAGITQFIRSLSVLIGLHFSRGKISTMPCLPKHMLGALALAGILSGCAVGPSFQRPDAPLRDVTFAPHDGDESFSLSAAPVPAAWWTLFDDTVLTSLQVRAARHNLSIQAASTRVAQSRAQLGIAGAALLPSVSASAGYSRTALSENGQMAALGAPTDASDLWEAGFQARWELDLWGHARRLRESAAASAEASLYDREVVRVAVAAEVARDYLLLRGRQAQLDIVRQNLEIARHAVRIAESRERNGVATRFDTAAARAQLASIEALALHVAHQRDTTMNALALLLGEQPRALDAELGTALPVPRMPRQIPVGLPSELARRRPDILEAEAHLHAATAAIGAAKADFYPRISLGGSLGPQAFDASDMGNWSSRQFSVGPTVHLPIFEGGRLKHTLALTEARAQAAAIAYQQAVLNAWHEVDNAISAYATEMQRYAQLRTAYEQSRLALDVSQRSYQEGTADYLSVLVAQRNLLDNQSALADGATTTSLTLVDLYKALAGGWNPAVLESQPALQIPVAARTTAASTLAAGSAP